MKWLNLVEFDISTVFMYGSLLIFECCLYFGPQLFIVSSCQECLECIPLMIGHVYGYSLDNGYTSTLMIN